ncbi:SRPBCC family protein [Flavobacterium sp.]|uniref:SRPBCC family protein n=1 Tax=Flavobacterium sp. TaxID=239 RepID=UPI0026066D17|nr:SRPBCC family protein [Flavobacterium sp.]
MAAENFNTDPDLEIIASRIINASQSMVFEAWANPNHLKHWWGPAGFTNTFHEFDLRVGGKWDFTMHGPDKGHYHNLVEFTKIEKPVRIEWRRHSKPLFNIAARFDKVTENTTSVSFRMIFDTAEECSKLRPYVVDKNEENLDRLESELAKMK